ncbi:MAG: hypothetical protein EOM59_17930 [Clostridia bacterium]|nr:hypothetical protein [Clostridia bacterium]
MKFNGSPFMPMSWIWQYDTPKLKIDNPAYADATFDEWEDENGRKKHNVYGRFPDNDRTPFFYTRWDKFIQPSEIEAKYKEIFKPRA